MNWLPYLVGSVIALFLVFQLFMWLSMKQLKGRHVPAFGPGPAPSSEQERTLYYFYAGHCGYCRNMNPIIDELCMSHGNVLKVDTEEYADVARKLGIRGVPAVLIVQQGVIRDALLGVQSRQRLEKLLGG
jgi:thioredoxin 1